MDQVGRHILFYAARKGCLVDMRIIMENSKFTGLEQKDQDGLTVLDWCDLWGFAEGKFKSSYFIYEIRVFLGNVFLRKTLYVMKIQSEIVDRNTDI